MRIGYARKLNHEDNLDEQVTLLKKHGCTKICIDDAATSYKERPELIRALDMLREEDTLIVYRMDCLGINIKHLMETLQHCYENHIRVQFITEGIELGDIGEKNQGINYFFELLTHFKESRLQETGLLRGKGAASTGRPASLSDKQVEQLELLVKNGATAHELSMMFNLTPVSVYRYLKKLNLELVKKEKS